MFLAISMHALILLFLAFIFQALTGRSNFFGGCINHLYFLIDVRLI